MIIALRHTGLIVANLQEQIDFYCGLGMKLRRRDLESGPFIDRLLGDIGVELETAKLVIEDVELPPHRWFNLELMKCLNGLTFLETPTARRFSIREVGLGPLDLAFTVKSLNEALLFVESMGGNIIGKPVKAVLGFPAVHCYARDPEGNVLHLVENIK